MPTVNKLPHHRVEVFPHLPAVKADGLKRELLGDNKTSSLVDPHFAEYRREDGLTPQEIRELKDWNFCLNRSLPSIEQHFEKRISQLFIQAVVCYRTGYRFCEGHTIHQGLGAHHIPLGGKEKLKFEAAHSPTIPCLYAYSEETKEKSVFLYRSGIYDESNATIDLLKAVNEADSAIDWMDAKNSLRKKTVELLNKAAKGELTPEQVSKQFALQLIETIDAAHEKAKKSDVKDVLQLYRDQAELSWSYVDSPEHIDRWLNLDLEDPFFKAATVTVDRLKQGAPADRTEILQLIKKKIDQLPVIIHQERHQKFNESRAPAYFYDLFFLELFKKIKVEDVHLIEEATGVESKPLAQRAKAFERTGITQCILAQNATKINRLIAELKPLLSRLKGQMEGNDQVTTLSAEKKVSLRPGVYQLRYQMIRKDQEAQSVIKSKIESIWHQIQKTSSAAYLEDFFHSALLAHAPDEKTRQMFCNLLSIRGPGLEQKIQEIKVNRNAHSALEKHSLLISKLGGRVLQLPSVDAKKEIADLLRQIKSSSNATSIDILFYKRLFNLMDTPQKKAQMAQLMGRRENIIDLAIAQKSTTPVIETTIKNHDAKIKEIITVATKAFQELRASTRQFRRELMVELRLSHGMSQDHFKAIYKQKFPRSPMSDGTMSNLENGKKIVDETIIGQLSSIFGIAKDIFHPSHFAE